MKIKFTLLLMAMAITLMAQKDIKLVDVPNLGLNFIPNKFCFEHEGNYYFQYSIITDKLQFGELQAQGIGLVVYDNDLKEIKKIELKGNKKNEAFITTFYSNMKTFLLTSFKEDKLQKFMLYSFDLNGNRLSEKEIFKSDWLNSFKVYTSSDSSKIALMAEIDRNNRNENCKIIACILDTNGNLLWDKPIDFLVNSKESDFKMISIDNKGTLNAIVDKKLKDKSFKYTLYQINVNNTKEVDLKSKELIGMISSFETKDGLYFTGWNQKLKEDEFRNPFIVQFNPNESVINIPFDVIEPSILKPFIDNEFYWEKYGWSNMMNLKHAWKNIDGEFKVVFQKKYTSSVLTGRMYSNYIDYENYYLCTFSKDWKLIDMKLCPFHSYKEVSELFEPIYSFVHKDAIYMVYYEFDSNINLVALGNYKNKDKGDGAAIIRKFSDDGKIQDIKLTKALKKQYPMANVTAVTKNNDVIFLSGEYGFIQGKNFKMGKFNLDIFQK